MSNGITTATNSLSADLLLNKIMNGQVQTDSGKTVSLASRVTSTNLNLDAVQANAYVPAIEEGKTIAEANQSKLTAIRNSVSDAVSNLVGVTDLTTAQSLATQLNTLLGTSGAYGKDLTAAAPATATTVNLGLGGGTLNTSANNTVLSAGLTAFTTALGDVVSADADTLEGALADLNAEAKTFLSSVASQEGLLSQTIQTLDSRTAILNDLASTYSTGASNQYLQGAGDATDLLNNVLG